MTTSGIAFPVADDEGFGQSQVPLPLKPPIKSANYLYFKLSSKRCLNCNLSNLINRNRSGAKISQILCSCL